MSKPQILEGSRAIALTIKNINPAVVSAYPITPQTHIVEDLARFLADGEAKYEYKRAESEFAAASIVLGASATGVRTYSSTSSQGLLLMAEVLFNIAGLRLPIVMTCANRAISAPINIWNDHQDAVTIRDAGWIMFYSENHQEAVLHHILAYKIAEKLNLPVMVNVDGFVLTHSYEEVTIPEEKEIKKFLPDRKPKDGEFLDPENPRTFGPLVTPAHYLEMRQAVHEDMLKALAEIEKEYQLYLKKVGWPEKRREKNSLINNGLVEYYGPKNAQTLFVALGSVAGTIKEIVDEEMAKPGKGLLGLGAKKAGVLKIKTYRPFPAEAILSVLKQVKPKNIAITEKAISLGAEGPLAADLKSAIYGKYAARVNDFVFGLGGRDITKQTIRDILAQAESGQPGARFIAK